MKPTAAFYGKVGKYAALDLEEEAVKMAGWLKAKRGRLCSTAFVLNWLKRALMPQERTNGHSQPADQRERATADPPRPRKPSPFAQFG
jgi:hypothetical protein